MNVSFHSPSQSVQSEADMHEIFYKERIMKPYKVYLVEHIHPTALAKLQKAAEIVEDPTIADAAINRNIHMTRAWLEQCPNLKVIGIHGTGTDDVELPAARERGIQVINAPGQNADSVAELIVAFALMLQRHIFKFDRQIQSGDTPVTGGGTLVGRELAGKTFGMVGCGNVAKKAAAILKNGFGMKIIGYSPSLTPEKAAEQGIGYCSSVAEVVQRADIINIGTPLKADTVHLINQEILSQAKPGSVLINTARGQVIDEDALYNALTNGPLAAAACDVFTQEPPTKQNRLISLPNFLATPHIGANTDEALDRVSNSTVDQVLAILEGRTDETQMHWVK